MIAKITSKNQLTLPKSVVQAIGATEYFDVEVRQGQIVLTPVRWVRSGAAAAGGAEPSAANAPAKSAAKRSSKPQPKKKAAPRK